MHQKTLSTEIYQKMCDVIPGGVNSPVRSCRGVDHPPMVVESGSGDVVTDVDGNQFIDYCGSWGALIHGHCHPQILQAITKRMEKGTTFGITCSIEEKLASKVVNLIDSIDKVRFVNSGTEATMTAVRVARGFTGRDLIVKFNGNYHGHADFFLVKAGSGVYEISSESSSAGIPHDVVKHVVSLPYNATQTVKDFLNQNQVAAVILEPIACNMGVIPASQEFMTMLREETTKQGALLIFDEVITGFRVGLKGAQSLYGISPDITCFGKVIGGGLPVGAFGARNEIMNVLAPEGPVYQAGTLSGNPLTMEAGYQTLCMCEEPGVFQELERKTQLITEPLKEMIAKKDLNACVHQVGSLFTLFFGVRSIQNYEEGKSLDLKKYAALFRSLYQQGIYIPPSQFESWFVSTAHQESHLKKTRDVVLKFLEEE